MQEISSFNPIPSDYEGFHIERGEELYAQRGLNTSVGGALGIFEKRSDVTIVPAYGARSGSAGPLSAAGWARLSGELLSAVEANVHAIDGIYVSLHGAMGAESELDPEGHLLTEIRRMAGSDIPIVISLDLHGILTDRMLRQVDGLAIYHTYPHVDFADTGERAARLLLKLLDGGVRPVIARVVIPALVRGDELVTKIGCYGDLIRECQRLERDGSALAAGIMIGNPFTDVPELCSQVLVMTDGTEPRRARGCASLGEFWPQRFRMQGKLISLDRAIAQARTITGPVIFYDAPTRPHRVRRATRISSSKPCARLGIRSACWPRSSIPVPRRPAHGPASAPPSRSISAAPRYGALHAHARARGGAAALERALAARDL
jgi:microcystin degradation protein MlrC